jgi:hypothetical protein
MSKPIAIRGRKGVYLVYYLAEFAHARLLGNLNEEKDSWVSFPADADTWVPLAVFTILAWENNIERECVSSSSSRDSAWKSAHGLTPSKRARFYNEWFDEGHWYVAVLHAKEIV